MRLPERIGRYRVQALVGTGGFGYVVRAFDEALEDSVAIKVLAENWAADEDIRRRFVDEAKLLRRIRSDDLVTVHDIGETEDGRPFFVMTFAERGTLSDRLSARRSVGLDPPSARALVQTLANGLGSLHAAGIIHRDVNPRNILVRPLDVHPTSEHRRGAVTQLRTGLIGADERLLLGDLGLAKDFVRAGAAGASVVGGTPHFLSPEQLDPAAEIGPTSDVYSATGVIWEAVTSRRPPAPADLRTAVSGVDEKWRPFFLRGLAEDPSDRHPDIEEWRAAALALIDEAETAGGVGGGGRADVRTIATNPYKGLAAFQPEDAARFFGRDALVASLVERLANERVLVVAGPSGSGKSSVVRAGLIPAIGGGAIAGSERWPVALFTPRSSPMAELSYQIARLAHAVTQQTVEVPASIDPRDPGRIRFVADVVADASGGAMLVVDQFEEIFTLNGPAEQQAFIDVLAGLTDPTDSRIRLVITMRADFYGASASIPWLAERISSNQVLVGPMSRSELRESIEAPAMVAALRLEDGLVDAILDEGGDEPNALPLVSHAMAETWRRRRGSTLTLEGYREAGGVGGAIATTAEALYEGRFDAEQKAACRRLMLRLVAPGEGTSDSRRRLPMEALEFDHAPDVSRWVTDEMVGARLLTVDQDSIEIAHEALLSTWPRLRRWIEESRDDLRMRHRLAHAAAEWRGQERDPDLLYRGTPLQVALEWADEHGEVLGPDDREFLAASEDAHLAAERVASAQRRRARRIRRIAAAVLAMSTAVAVAASIVAFSALGEATSRFGQSLATQAAALVGADPRAAAALAVEAMARGETDSLDARVALVEAAGRLATTDFAPIGSPVVAGDALSVAADPTGRIVATGNRDGSIRLWSTRAEPLGPPRPGHEKGINEMVFTPDGRGLVTASDDGTIRFWDVGDPSGSSAPLLVGMGGRLIWSVDIAPDGRTLASASEDGTIVLWDLVTRSPIGEPLADSERDFLTISFSPDGALLLAGNGRGEVTGWSLPSREIAIETFNAHDSDVWEIEFAPDGGTFGTASSDGRVRIWDTATATLLGEPFDGAAGDVRGLQMLGSGQVAAGDERGRLWTGTLDGDSRLSVPSPHRGQIIDSGRAGDFIATLGDDQQLQIWRAAQIPTAIELEDLPGGAFGVAVSPDAEVVAVGDGEGNVTLASADSGAILDTFDGVHVGQIWAVAFSADGSDLATGGIDGRISVLDPRSGGDRFTVDGDGAAITALEFHGERLLAGRDDGTVAVFVGRTVEATLPGHRGGVTGIDVSGDGRIAVSDRSGTVTIWDVEDLRSPVDVVAADDNTIWDVAWSPDDSLLATASADEAVQLWDADSLEPVVMLAPHRDGALSVEFLPDGVTLAATSGNGTVRLWDIVLARPIGAALEGHTDSAWRIAGIPGSERFVTTDQDGSVRIWDVLDVDRACERAAGAFDMEHRRRSLGEDEPLLGCLQ